MPEPAIFVAADAAGVGNFASERYQLAFAFEEGSCSFSSAPTEPGCMQVVRLASYGHPAVAVAAGAGAAVVAAALLDAAFVPSFSGGPSFVVGGSSASGRSSFEGYAVETLIVEDLGEPWPYCQSALDLVQACQHREASQ